MSILVTGGAGYIGSHVVRQLSEAQERVVVLDDLSSGFADSLINGEKLYVGDVDNRDLVSEIIRDEKISAVMHFAGSIVVPESFEKPIEYYSNNSMKTLSLIGNCVAAGVDKFIFSSTAAVYGQSSNGICGETDVLSPLSPYGVSKLMSEWMLRDISLAHPLNYIVLRYFNVAGADPEFRMGQRSPHATHLIKISCQAALGLRPQVEIYGNNYETPDGTCVRDYVHVEDLAHAHICALRKLVAGGPSGIYNVGYGEGKSVLEVIETVKAISKVNFKTVFTMRRNGDSAKLIAQATRIKEDLGWAPRFQSLEKIITDAWKWELISKR